MSTLLLSGLSPFLIELSFLASYAIYCPSSQTPNIGYLRLNLGPSLPKQSHVFPWLYTIHNAVYSYVQESCLDVTPELYLIFSPISQLGCQISKFIMYKTEFLISLTRIATSQVFSVLAMKTPLFQLLQPRCRDILVFSISFTPHTHSIRKCLWP